MLKQFTVTVATLMHLQTALAQNEEAEMAAFMAMLDEQTALATQSKINADYVPGMVSVLHGQEMLKRGANSVADALQQIAGFHMTVRNNGDFVSIVRGIGGTTNGKNIKVMINGVALNQPVEGTAEWALKLPLNQVDRIEVIRGPGSALYGEFAFSGVVNIITRKGNAAQLRAGRHALKQGDIQLHKTFADAGEVRLNLSAWDRDDSGNKTGIDNFGRNGNGYSPADVYDREQSFIALSQLSLHGYSLSVDYSHSERGAWYGTAAALPEALSPRIEEVVSLQLEKQWDIHPDFNLRVSLHALNNDLQNAEYMPLPAGVRPPGPPAPPLQYDQYRQDGTEDLSIRGTLQTHWQVSNNHNIYGELSYLDIEVSSSFTKIGGGATPMHDAPPDRVRVADGATRQLSSITLQDSWKVSDTLELTFGARFDDYSDWGSHTTPRFASVWRAGNQHIFKFQYAEAFRPPTMAEAHTGASSFGPQPPVTEEELHSTELAYIFRGTGYTFRSTLFNTGVEDLIEFYLQPGRRPFWRNRGDITAKGLELEWQQSIDRDWQWQANVSYVDAEDHLDEVDGVLVGSIEWLANLGLVWRKSAHHRHSLYARYASPQENWELQLNFPTPESYGSFITLDYTWAVDELFKQKGLSLLLSVNNLLDESYASISNPPNFPDGLPQGQTTTAVQLSYEF